MSNLRHRRNSLIILLAGVGITLLLAGIVPLVMAQEDEGGQATTEVTPPATETVTPEAVEAIATDILVPPGNGVDIASMPPITGDNSYCGVCHSQPWRSITLDDGYILNLFVAPETVASSVHGGTEHPVGCIDCHGEDAFPHNSLTPSDLRSYTLDGAKICESCHADQAGDLEQGLHAQAIALGNTAAAVCTDCHGAHDVQPGAQQPQLVAGVCGDCHTSSVNEWRASPHVDIGPLGCATCHNPHSQNLRIGTSADELCLKCHKDPSDQWIHTQHLTTDSQVTCLECHMYTGQSTTVEAQEAILVSAPGTMPTGHSMEVNTVACTTCHSELPVATGPEVAGTEVAAVSTAIPVNIDNQTDAVTAATDQTGFIQLIQGLILGLGLGATVAAVFVSRGNQKSS